MKIIMNFENAIKITKMRKDRNLTQAEFATKTGIPLRTLQQWERGARNPPEYVINLLKYFLESREGEQLKIKFKCENCYHYEFEEDEYGNRYNYCKYFDCQLCEIAGLDDCENYDQMPNWGIEER